MDYWERRALERAESVDKTADAAIKTISKAYQRAQRAIGENAQALLRRYQSAYGIDAETARKWLASPCSRDEYLELLERIARCKDKGTRLRLQARAASGAYAYRLKREAVIKAGIDAEVSDLATATQKEMDAALRSAAEETYLRTLYDISIGTGINIPPIGPAKDTISAILREKWSGMNYPTRIWGNAQSLANELQEALCEGIMTGDSSTKLLETLQGKFGVSLSAANRLVRTESNYVENEAEMRGYEDAEIERYRFLATLEKHTCGRCGELDGQIFEVKDRKVGKNAPPIHPHCRCTTTAVIDEDDLKRIERLAKDPKTGEYTKVRGDMTFKEWKKENRLLNESITDKPKIPITDEAISKVPSLDYSGWSTEKNQLVQEQCWNVLRIARDENNGDEVAIAISGDGRTRVQFGDTKTVSITETTRGMGTGVVVVHNHPRGASLSLNDVTYALRDADAEAIIAVKPNGNVELLVKSVDCDKKKAYTMAARLDTKTKGKSDGEKSAIIAKWLKTLGGKDGVRWMSSEK